MTFKNCGHTRTPENVYEQNDSKGYRYGVCRICRATQAVRYKLNNPSQYARNKRDTVIAIRLRNTGWTDDQYTRAYAAQGGLCAICEKNEGQCADHDHSRALGDGQRALLCKPCNLLLGNSEENPTRLIRAAEYLLNYKGGPSHS